MKRLLSILSLLMITMLMLCACSTGYQHKSNKGIDFTTIEKTGEWKLEYAKQFCVEEYGKYYMLTIAKKDKYLIVPSGEKVPYGMENSVAVLQQPLDHTYLVSSSVMDFMRELDALGFIKLTGVKKEDWYIDGIQEKMEDGSIEYAGKYSAPDYELLLAKDCSLAIENTMIGHNPEVKEKIEELGIPVLTEYSSYESHPLGRLEWIKVYGLLYGKQEEAKKFYEEQLKALPKVADETEKKHTVAFFYITSNGTVNVRKPNDYIAKMIELAGGKYAFSDVVPEEENALSTMNMQMEDFYRVAKDADILIYNSTIDGTLENVEELLGKSEVLKNCKAVKMGNVYCTKNDFFQETTGVCKFINDMVRTLKALEKQEEQKGYAYLYKLK